LNVGSTEFEIPVSALHSPSPPPTFTTPISSVSFRVFYPAEDRGDASRATYWIPDPQGEFVGGYARFLRVSSVFSSILSYANSAVHLLITG
jgi:platelet-activating factor acetylhydrolase